MKKITFSVTNDLNFDQRMQRICSALSEAGYEVLLIGRSNRHSPPLHQARYQQKRLPCFFSTGKAMYLEYNLRLLLLLCWVRTDCFVAIDLDTILPNLLASAIRRKKRVYDAHEWFTQQKEIVTRPFIRKIWTMVENFAVPKFKWGYTVNQFIADTFADKFSVRYKVVRNVPFYNEAMPIPELKDRYVIYQGAVNEGRCFESLIPAMKEVDARLIICGKGNFFKQTEQLITHHNLAHKVELRGWVAPGDLSFITRGAAVGITLFENNGMNQYQSLANRFFDYIMAGVPQVCVNFPQYRMLNEEYGVAELINDTDPKTIASALNKLLDDDVYHNRLAENCLLARKSLNWEREKQVLLNFYKRYIG